MSEEKIPITRTFQDENSANAKPVSDRSREICKRSEKEFAERFEVIPRVVITTKMVADGTRIPVVTAKRSDRETGQSKKTVEKRRFESFSPLETVQNFTGMKYFLPLRLP